MTRRWEAGCEVDNETNKVISVNGDMSFHIPEHHASDDYDMCRESVNGLRGPTGILLGLILSIPLWVLIIWGIASWLKG